MRLLLAVIPVSMFAAMPLLAQSAEVPPIDIYGAYSHSSNFGIGQSGWLGSANYHVVPNFGVEADVSGNYGTKGLGTLALILLHLPKEISSHMHSFNVGPRFTYRPFSNTMRMPSLTCSLGLAIPT